MRFNQSFQYLFLIHLSLSLSHPHTHILSLLVAHANTHSLSLSLSLECSPILCLTLLWFFLTATFNITNCLRKSLAHRYTVSTHQRFNGSVPITQASFMSISHLSLFLSFFLSFFLSLTIFFFLSISLFSLSFTYYLFLSLSLFLSTVCGQSLSFFHLLSISFSLYLFLSLSHSFFLPVVANATSQDLITLITNRSSVLSTPSPQYSDPLRI